MQSLTRKTWPLFESFQFALKLKVTGALDDRVGKKEVLKFKIGVLLILIGNTAIKWISLKIPLVLLFASCLLK